MRPFRSVRRIAGALGVCLAAATLAAPSASSAPSVPSAPAAPRFSHYVALGDSYTSGPLIPLQRLDPLGCFRSTTNYPSLLAAALHPATFTDVSCGGADTSNMVQPQSVPLGSNPPQFNALHADTDLVTLGIGGNDFSLFGTLVNTCTKLRGTDPTGAPCRKKYTVNGVDTLKAKLPAIRVHITAVLAGIHQRAPHAKVVVLGYPRILPPKGTCVNQFPAADGDYVWGNELELGLNAAVSGAVADDGHARYVDTFGPSLGHDLCAGPHAWINGQYLNPLAAYSYHPFAAEMFAEAGLTYVALGFRGAVPSTAPVTGPVASPAQVRAALGR